MTWADEVLHTRIRRRRLRAERLTTADALAIAAAAWERTWNAPDPGRVRHPQPEWRREFVREVLGTQSAAPDEAVEPQPLTS